MNCHLVTFNTNFRYNVENYFNQSKERLISSFKKWGISNIFEYNESNLPCPVNIKLYFEKYATEGYGFYAWKPVIILDAMSKINDGDVIIYHDVGRPEYKYELKKDINQLINVVIKHYQGIGMCEGPFKHREYTKDKCFELMKCNTSYVTEKNQLTANWMILEKNPKTLDFLNDWMKYCLNHDIVCTSVAENNHKNFIAHRWDQSILTNLFHMYSLKPLPSIIFGWEKDINNYIYEYDIKSANTFNTLDGLTLILDIFYRDDTLIVLTTGAVSCLYVENKLYDECVFDLHENNNIFKFKIQYKRCIKLTIQQNIGVYNEVKMIISKNYYGDFKNEHVLSAICKTSINSLSSIVTFVKYHLNLGYDRILLHENGGDKFIELYNALLPFKNNVILICWNNIKFYQKLNNNYFGENHVTNVGETSQINHALNLCRESNSVSAFNIDELIVIPNNTSNKINKYIDELLSGDFMNCGGIAIYPYDFQKPNSGEIYYKSKILVNNVNNVPKIIYFPKTTVIGTCHDITIGLPPKKIDKDKLCFNHYPFLDNNRYLGESIGEFSNLNFNLF